MFLLNSNLYYLGQTQMWIKLIENENGLLSWVYFMGMSETHRDVDKVLSFETSAPLPWPKADLIKIRDPEQSPGRKSRDINGQRSASRAESAEKPPAELNGSFLSCLEHWLEAAWQCLLGRQFLAHRFIWAGQFALVLRHSDKNALNHWQTLDAERASGSISTPRAAQRRKMF